MLAYRMGERVKTSRGGLRAYQLGVGLQSAVVRNLESLVISDEAAARLVADAWWKHRTPDDPEVFAEAIRMEYRIFASDVDERSADGAAYMAPELFRWLAKTRVLYPLVMKPNLTKALYADYLRRQVEWCDLPEVEYQARGGYSLLELELRDVLKPVNLYGRMTAWDARHPAVVYARRVEYRSAVSAFEAVLALRLYHAEHGALPEMLDALVPRYLPAVPVDYHDGAPIRYSRVSAEVWSEGPSTARHRLDFAVAPAP